MTELTCLDGLAQAALVRSGEVAPDAPARAAIERIEAVNETLNAVIFTRYERALDEARTAPAAAPFASVPTLLKDMGCTLAGAPNGNGNRLLRDLDVRPSVDAALTTSIRGAGMAILGRTNVPEFGLVNTTEPRAFGAARNPWNLGRSTGGSSGGSAAAVAAGMVPIAQASDGGGSIRMPASHCGVFGLKPSWGRISAAPEAVRMETHPTYGFVSRSVRDSAAALDLASGYRTGDAAVAPRQASSYLDVIGREPGPLRIGLMDVADVNGFAVDPEVRRTVTEAAGLLEDLGHRVERSHPAAMEEAEFLDRWMDLLSPSVTLLFSELEELKGAPLERGDAEEMAWWWRDHGAAISAADHAANQVWRDHHRRRMAAWWDEFDLLLSPVLPVAATPLGYFDGAEGLERSVRILCFTPQFNMTGQPAASVPFGVTSDGLPVGIQLGAAYGREDLLLQVAAQIEGARPWVDRRPLRASFGSS
jgi:amidase